jgi:PII-like signaling protein
VDNQGPVLLSGMEYIKSGSKINGAYFYCYYVERKAAIGINGTTEFPCFNAYHAQADKCTIFIY